MNIMAIILKSSKKYRENCQVSGNKWLFDDVSTQSTVTPTESIL